MIKSIVNGICDVLEELVLLADTKNWPSKYDLYDSQFYKNHYPIQYHYKNIGSMNKTDKLKETIKFRLIYFYNSKRYIDKRYIERFDK